MENPEEILHSLEEFAKMKPKDIPRELEEYLKFVAKTGDPIYQWSTIKSLFREKLINVITEFYESCSCIEIPPCPNVELFNYELMKNFILEKLDTFNAAPFTLQRISELLTNPRKEYTRIDKYMRALEKNILVVSTTEPGGRRTENGDGVMNGLESDHEHIPEPGNEINVEEMDDTPSWHQNIQSNNHISEQLPFENAENEYRVSNTNQDIVCVQYVAVEPFQSEIPQAQSEEVNDGNISVSIASEDVKADVEIKEECTVLQQENPVAEMYPKETESSLLKIEVEPHIEPQSIQPSDDALKDESKEIDGSSNTLTDNILSKLDTELTSLESNPLQSESVVCGSTETEHISPETSVISTETPTSSDDISSALNVETIIDSTQDVGENKNVHKISESEQLLKTDSLDNKSDVEPLKENIIDFEVVKESNDTLGFEVQETNSNEILTPAQDIPSSDTETTSQDISSLEIDHVQPEEAIKIEELVEIEAQQDLQPEQSSQEFSDATTSQESFINKSEESHDQNSLNVSSDEKTSPMEQNTSDVSDEKTPMEQNTSDVSDEKTPMEQNISNVSDEKTSPMEQKTSDVSDEKTPMEQNTSNVSDEKTSPMEQNTSDVSDEKTSPMEVDVLNENVPESVDNTKPSTEKSDTSEHPV